MLDAIDGCPAPVVAAVQGHALGGGCGLVACCDVAIAAPDAQFAFSEVKLGIVPAVISPFALAKIGPSAARRWFVTGERFGADVALRIGLDARGRRRPRRCGDAGRRRAPRRRPRGGAGRRSNSPAPRSRPTRRRALIARHRTSDEGQEGLRAFLEKRARRGARTRRVPPFRDLTYPQISDARRARPPASRRLRTGREARSLDSIRCGGFSISRARSCSSTRCSSRRSHRCCRTTPTRSALGKGGAGVLSAAYPAGAVLGSLPSGIVAARFGVKPTVLVGLTIVAICTILFGIGDADVGARPRPLLPGHRERVLVDRRTRLARRRLAARAAGRADRPGVRDGDRRRALRPRPRRHRVGRRDAAGRSARSGSHRSALVAWAALMPSERPEQPQGIAALGRAFRDRRVLAGCWFVVLPSLLFGVVSVLGPLRLCRSSASARSRSAARSWSRPRSRDRTTSSSAGSPTGAARWRRSAAGSSRRSSSARCCPGTHDRFVLAVLIVCAELAFGTLFTPR